MIVITMTSCPAKLRGDLSLWLMEINTGVYVGHVNARVREALWSRVCENIRDGQATMVFTTNNEQHMEFYVHNTEWKPVDYDGMKLMKRPFSAAASGNALTSGFSNAAKQRMGRRSRQRAEQNAPYFLIDIETTGLSHEQDEIIEIGVLEVRNGVCAGTHQWLINTERELPEAITGLTGLTNDMLRENGVPIKVALQAMLKLVDSQNTVFYNAGFDCLFLETACRRNGLPTPDYRIADAMVLARSKLKGLADYKLETVASALAIPHKQTHRALDDCKLLFEVWQKLNEK